MDTPHTEKLSVDELRSLARKAGHRRERRSVEYALATTAAWAIDDKAHEQGACTSNELVCTSLEHEKQSTLHRWQQEGWSWRCSRCHLWVMGMARKGTRGKGRYYEAIYADNEFSPYVASGKVKGDRDLLFSDCDPAEGRRQLAMAARSHQESKLPGEE